MKSTEEIIFTPGSPEFIEGEISLRAVGSKDDRPADVTYSLGGQEHIERGFASLAYSPSSQSLVPVAELIKWKNFLLVLGRRSCLIFDSKAGLLVGKVLLNRLEPDDPGFCNINFQDFDEMLVVVYESRIFSVASTGILWHHKKVWDDLAASIDINSVVVTTGDEGHYTLDTRTGRML